MHIYIYIYTYTHTHTCAHIYIYIYTERCIYNPYTYVYVYIYIYIYMHVYGDQPAVMIACTRMSGISKGTFAFEHISCLQTLNLMFVNVLVYCKLLY